jgi:hypothetical protein
MRYLSVGNSVIDNPHRGDYLMHNGNNPHESWGKTLTVTYLGEHSIMDVGVDIRGRWAAGHIFKFIINDEVVRFVTCSSIVGLFLIRELKIGVNTLGTMQYQNRNHTWYYPTVNGRGIGLFGQSVEIPLDKSEKCGIV